MATFASCKADPGFLTRWTGAWWSHSLGQGMLGVQQAGGGADFRFLLGDFEELVRHPHGDTE